MLREYIDLTRARNPKQNYHLDLLSSYKGFLLFTAKAPWPDVETALIFYNPVTKEQLTVTAPPSTYVYCGFFFHSPTKEYRILYQFDDDHYDGVVQFELLGLQTRSLRKIYVNKRFSAKYHPDLSTPAVISNGALHWMVSEAPHQQVLEGSIPSCSETILSFGMESEEFHLMPHPRFGGGRHDCVSLQRTGSHKMNLLEMDGGVLCLCDGYYVLSLRIYVMTNYKKWKWVLKHTVSLHAYPGVIRCSYDLHVKALQIHQGELLLYYHPYRFTEEYLLYPLNQDAEEDELDDASYKFFKWLSFGSKNLKECFDDDGLTLKKKKKKEKTRFKVAIDQLILKREHYLDDDQYLRRMIISHPGTKPSSLENKLLDPPLTSSVGNIVVLTPSIASLKQRRQSTTNDNGGGGNYILSLQYENYSTVLTEYDVQTRKWKRVLVVDSSSSFQ